jgi:hypothetical protein
MNWAQKPNNRYIADLLLPSGLLPGCNFQFDLHGRPGHGIIIDVQVLAGVTFAINGARWLLCEQAKVVSRVHYLTLCWWICREWVK